MAVRRLLSSGGPGGEGASSHDPEWHSTGWRIATAELAFCILITWSTCYPQCQNITSWFFCAICNSHMLMQAWAGPGAAGFLAHVGQGEGAGQSMSRWVDGVGNHKFEACWTQTLLPFCHLPLFRVHQAPAGFCDGHLRIFEAWITERVGSWAANTGVTLLFFFWQPPQPVQLAVLWGSAHRFGADQVPLGQRLYPFGIQMFFPACSDFSR